MSYILLRQYDWLRRMEFEKKTGHLKYLLESSKAEVTPQTTFHTSYINGLKLLRMKKDWLPFVQDISKQSETDYA